MKYIIYFFTLIFFIALVGCSSSRFTKREKRIINNDSNNEVMLIMLVSNPTDSIILYKNSKNIKPDSLNKNLTKLIDRMYVTVRDTNNPGVGIAAPQLGINKRVIWVQRFDKTTDPFEYYLNTEIVYYSNSTSQGKEGCLSVPGYKGFVNRADTIIVNYDLLNQKNVSDTITGFTAIIFQHEIDHLEGLLYIDRIKNRLKTPK